MRMHFRKAPDSVLAVDVIWPTVENGRHNCFSPHHESSWDHVFLRGSQEYKVVLEPRLSHQIILISIVFFAWSGLSDDAAMFPDTALTPLLP